MTNERLPPQKTASNGKTSVPASSEAVRQFPAPDYLSPAAAATLLPSIFDSTLRFPAHHDKDAWRTMIAGMDTYVSELIAQTGPYDGSVEERRVDRIRLFVVEPRDLANDDRGVILDIHGGALIAGGGAKCGLTARMIAERFRSWVWSVDYRMPPDHPYPAGLDDCVGAYRAVLEERRPSEIIILGTSAGGNLAAATILRARDEGLPLPAAAVLISPEVDLTESGDSFHVNIGIDPILGLLMPVNLLYADGHDLKDSYLSPLFGDFTKGFPPTIITAGTRDLFLSNAVRMHRTLRAANIAAELHILDAAGHAGFPSTSPEGAELDRELRHFIHNIWTRSGTALSCS